MADPCAIASRETTLFVPRDGVMSTSTHRPRTRLGANPCQSINCKLVWHGTVVVKSSLPGLSRSNILCPKINREPLGFSQGGVSQGSGKICLSCLAMAWILSRSCPCMVRISSSILTSSILKGRLSPLGWAMRCHSISMSWR